MTMTDELSKEWCYEMNEGVDPIGLKRSSDYKAWWKCQKCTGTWQAKVKSRMGGSKCPYCAGRKVLKGFNDLATLYPELAAEWVSSENNKLPWEGSPGSHEKVIWRCKDGHEWTAEVKTRVSGMGCPYCSGRLPIKGVSDLASLHPELMKEWNWWENRSTFPDDVSVKSNKKYWWKCPRCKYEWQASPAHRLRSDRKKKSGCPCCNHKVAVVGKNDAATYNPEVALEWIPTLNEGRKLSEYLPNSNKYGIWKCRKCGYEWSAQIKSRVVDKKGCPCCAGKRVIPGVTDLLTLFPEVALEWDYKKNKEMTPDNVSAYSHKYAWWTCQNCNHKWRARIANRTLGKGCPRCASHC